MKNLLIIGHTLPEPTTAAGGRMMQLIGLFLEADYTITFVTSASTTEKSYDLQSKNVEVKSVLLNDSMFDECIKQVRPSVVVFDRFITEEQFGWRVSEQFPRALKILDTEDLHFLRKARQEAIKMDLPVTEANLFSETAKRELASILRCDLSLIISEYEMGLLITQFNISKEILFYLPFLVEKDIQANCLASYKERRNFIAIGNLLHAPNVDSVMQLKSIWPEIRKQIPESELHIYGAYAPQHIRELQNKKGGFILKGWAENLQYVMNQYRLQLAPLRFGAGLKGKLLDAMLFGMPTVTTAIGAEGINGELSFGGAVTFSKKEFIDASLTLYSNEQQWNKAQQDGYKIIGSRFEKSLFAADFLNKISTLTGTIEKHRNQNFIGQIFQHHTLQSSKYLSKWIELKNSAK